MEEACEYIERAVNAEMKTRERFPLEWGGEPADGGNNSAEVSWKANVAAANCYTGAKESVGYHSDPSAKMMRDFFRLDSLISVRQGVLVISGI